MSANANSPGPNLNPRLRATALSTGLQRTRQSIVRVVSTPLRQVRRLFESNGRADTSELQGGDLPGTEDRRTGQLAGSVHRGEDQRAASVAVQHHAGEISAEEGVFAQGPLFPEISDQAQRRFTIIPPLPTGIPARDADTGRAGVYGDRASLSSSESRRGILIFKKSLEENHITDEAYESLLRADASVFQLVLRQLTIWQDKHAMEGYPKRLRLEPSKTEIFRAQDAKQPLYQFLKAVAAKDPVSGFILRTMRPVCLSDEEHRLAELIFSSCSTTHYDMMCTNTLTYLQIRMPSDELIFSEAARKVGADPGLQLQKVTELLARKYIITDRILATTKKEEKIRHLSSALGYSGLSTRLEEIKKANAELSTYCTQLTDDDRYRILMHALRNVDRSDNKKGEYKDLAGRLADVELENYLDLVEKINQVEHSYMPERDEAADAFICECCQRESNAEQEADEHLLVCEYCKKDGHSAQDCRKKKRDEKSKDSAFKGRCFKCGETGHRKAECKQQQKGSTPAAGQQGEEKAMLIMVDEQCYTLSGAVPMEKAEVHGIFKLCETQVVPGASSARPKQRERAEDHVCAEEDCCSDGEGCSDGEATPREPAGRTTTGTSGEPEMLDLSLYAGGAGDNELAGRAVERASIMLHAIQADVVNKADFKLEDVDNKALLLLGSRDRNARAIIDNACTCAVTDRLDLLKNVRRQAIGFQGVGRGTAEYVGEAAFKVRTSTGQLIDCPPGMKMAYMPDLRRTILSFHHLKELGWIADLIGGVMQCGSTHKAQLTNENRLDYMHIIPNGDAEEKVLLMEDDGCCQPDETQACYLMSPKELHAMTCHCGKKATIATLKKMTDIKIGNVDAMDFGQFCHECAMGKMQNARKGCGLIHAVPEAKVPCQLISIDLMLKFAQSPAGLKYALSAIDHKSDHGWVECIKHKDDAYEAVDKILHNARALTGYTGTITVMCDNEPLMTCEKMQQVLKNNNAVRVGSIEYEHRSNGLIEKHNQRLQRMARIAFVQSGLVPELWPLVMTYAQAVLNRIVRKDGKAPVEKFYGGEVRGADLGIFGALTYYVLPKEHRENDKLAQRAGIGVYVGPAEAYGKSNGVAVLVQQENGKFKVVYTASVKYDNSVFPFRHGLQEVLTSRQYKPILDALKGAAALDLEYEAAPEAESFDGTQYDLLGRDIRMVVKGRTRFGQGEWFGKITDIIRDDKDPKNEEKMLCRVFFQPSAEHPEGAYQNIPLQDARKMVVESEIVALVLELMDKTVMIEQLYATIGTAHRKNKKKGNKFTSLRAALQQPDAAAFQAAWDKEIGNLKKHGAFEPGTPGPNDIIGRLICLLERKEHKDALKGITHKARVVIDGSGLPHADGYAPVARMEALITILAIMIALGLSLAQQDTASAYLHAKAPRTVFVRPLPGMEDPTGKHKFMKTLKAVYGELAAGRAYFGFHIDVHIEYGFEKVTRDGTILLFRTTVIVDGEEVESILLLVTIVDDSILGFKHREVAEKYFEYLRTKADIVVSFEPKVFVGIEIDYNLEKRVVKLSQTAYLQKIAQQFGINKEDPKVTSPWDAGTEFKLAEGVPDPALVEQSRRMIGAISWAANATRKDAVAPIRTAARVMHKPTPELIKFLLCILQWLFNTRNRALTFRGREWVTLDGTKIAVNQLAAFADSSYANAGPEFQMKSQYGYAVFINGGCVAAGSGLGPHPVDSSSYAEVVALHIASKDIVYLTQIVDVVCKDKKPPRPIVFEDNTTAIAVMMNNKSATRSRHFDIKYFYLADLIQRGLMVLKYVPTEFQVADVLTKPTPNYVFQKLTKCLMGEE